MSFIRFCRGDLEKQRICKNRVIKSKSFVVLSSQLGTMQFVCSENRALFTFDVNSFSLLEKKLGGI